MRMDAGVSTLEHECSEHGLDWEEVLEQQKVEQDKRADLGLTATTWAVIAEKDLDEQEGGQRSYRRGTGPARVQGRSRIPNAGATA